MTTSIHPTAIVAEGATLAKGVTIGPYSLIGPHVILKENVKIHGHVVVDGRTTVGQGTEVFPFATIGLIPQDLKYSGEDSFLEIGEKCTIREHATIHLGTKEGGMKTILGNGCLIMVGAHIAHDCRIGNFVILANNATLGGHVTIGDYAIIGGLAAIHQFVQIGAYAIISGTAGVTKDIIPFGAVVAAKGKLGGLNLIGMKRKKFTREEIHNLRNAYNLLANKQIGSLEERVAAIKESYSQCSTVQQLLEFLEKDHKQSLCFPEGEWVSEGLDVSDERHTSCA